jgi:hypothetical protein
LLDEPTSFLDLRFKKEIFQSLGGFDTRFPVANNEDTELSYRMAAQGHRMVFNPRAVVCHLNHPDSILRYLRLKFSRGFWRMMVYRMFPDKIDRIYAGYHGIEGVLREELLDLSVQDEQEIALLRNTPAAGAIGTCRYKMKKHQCGKDRRGILYYDCQFLPTASQRSNEHYRCEQPWDQGNHEPNRFSEPPAQQHSPQHEEDDVS